jgi:hypothetical protein
MSIDDKSGEPFVNELNRRWAREIEKLIDWQRHARLEAKIELWRFYLLAPTLALLREPQSGAPPSYNRFSRLLRLAERLPPLFQSQIRQALGTAWWSSIDAESWTVEPVARGADPLWVYGAAAPEWARWIEGIRANMLVSSARSLLDDLRDGNVAIAGHLQEGGFFKYPSRLSYLQFQNREVTIYNNGRIIFRDFSGVNSIYQNVIFTDLRRGIIADAELFLREAYGNNPNMKHSEALQRATSAGYPQRVAAEALKRIPDRRKRGERVAPAKKSPT